MKSIPSVLIIFLFSNIHLFYSQEKQDVKSLHDNREYEKVIAILKMKNAKEELTLDELYFLARSYGKVRKYNNELAYVEKMIKKASKTKDTNSLVKAFNLKAETLIDLGKIEKGYRFCDKVNNVFRLQDSLQFQKFCFKWGMFAYHNEDYQKAYSIYNRIRAKKYRDLSLFNHNYALTLEGLKKYNEAIFYFKKDVDSNIKSNKVGEAIMGLCNIVHIYLGQGKLKEAKHHLDMANSFSRDKLSLYYRKTLLKRNYFYYRKSGQIDSAKLYLDKIDNINNEIFDKKLNEEIDLLKLSFEKEKELNTELQTEKAKTLVVEKQKLKQMIIGLVMLFGLLTAFFVYFYKNIKIKYQNLKLEQKVLRSQITPHFIFNSFSVLQGMILNKEVDKSAKYVSTFSKLMRTMLHNSRDEFILLSEELENLENYIELQNMKSENIISYSFDVNDTVNPNNLFIPSMLLQPFVENCIKHGFKKGIEKPEIKIEIFMRKEDLVCEIIDNGLGIYKTKEKKSNGNSSLGTIITKERLEVLSKDCKTNFSFKIKDRKEENKRGTIVEFNLPYKTAKNVKSNNSRR